MRSIESFLNLFKENSFIAFTSFLIGLIGTASSFYFYYKTEEMKRKIKRFEWDEIELGVQYLAKEVLINFKPEFILSLSFGGNIITSLLHKYSDKVIPIVQTIYYDEKQLSNLSERILIRDLHIIIEIPSFIRTLRDKRIAIIDDTVVTGDVLEKLKVKLTENGITNFKCFSLFASPISIESRKGPDSYWKKIDETDYQLPWGDARGICMTHGIQNR